MLRKHLAILLLSFFKVISMPILRKSFAEVVSKLGKLLMKVIVVILMIALSLSTLQLVIEIVKNIINPPYYFLIDVKELYSIFKLCLIIVVGYELMKSLLLIVESDNIPVVPIISIGIIAVVNKIITLDFQATDAYTIGGLAGLLLALAVAKYLAALKNTDV
jgi:uncharacterized membrane protein (DUF373 family)